MLPGFLLISSPAPAFELAKNPTALTLSLSKGIGLGLGFDGLSLSALVGLSRACPIALVLIIRQNPQLDFAAVAQRSCDCREPRLTGCY